MVNGEGERGEETVEENDLTKSAPWEALRELFCLDTDEHELTDDDFGV